MQNFYAQNVYYSVLAQGMPFFFFTVCNLTCANFYVCVQEIYQDRKKFSEQVFKVASSDLVNMGIGVVSYTLKDVHDDQVCQVCLSTSSSNTGDKTLTVKALQNTLEGHGGYAKPFQLAIVSSSVGD